MKDLSFDNVDTEEEKEFADLTAKLRELPVVSMRQRAVWSLNLALTRRFIAKALPVGLEFRLPRLAVTVALLAVMIVSVPAYAYTSDHVTLDSPLYPIKTGLEQLELSLAPTPTLKADTYDKMAQRRLDEAAYLAQNPATAPATIIKTVDTARAFVEESNAIQATTSAVIRERRQVQLSNIAAAVGIRGDETLVESVALTFEASGRKNKNRSVRPPRTIEHSADDADNEIPVSSAYATDTPAVSAESDDDSVSEPTTTPPDALERVRRSIRPDRQDEDNDRSSGKREEKTASKPVSVKADKDESLNEDLAELRQRINAMKNEITNEEYDQNSINLLFGQLERRYFAAAEAIENGEANAAGLLRAAEAVTNNAKRFLKPVNIEKSKENTALRENEWQDEQRESESEYDRAEKNQTRERHKNER